MGAPAFVTTSWDDGDPSDIRLTELLSGRGIRATFYVPIMPYADQGRLDRAGLRSLWAAGFDIGAHSVSHRNLATLGPADLAHEVRDCNHMLQDELGSEVRAFCYPNGRYNSAVIREVKDAGYRGARTTRMLARDTQFTPYQLLTTLQAYPHHLSAYCKNILWSQSFGGLLTLATNARHLRNRAAAAAGFFDQVLERGGIWHLFGHSWEISRLSLWPELTALLDYVAHRAQVKYVTNAEIFTLFGECAQEPALATHEVVR